MDFGDVLGNRASLVAPDPTLIAGAVGVEVAQARGVVARNQGAALDQPRLNHRLDGTGGHVADASNLPNPQALAIRTDLTDGAVAEVDDDYLPAMKPFAGWDGEPGWGAP